MTAEEFWTPWESQATSWVSALERVERIVAIAGRRELVWRGAIDARWSLQSSLYRRLQMKLGAPPSEVQVIEYEQRILEQCYRNWRYDGTPALMMMAQLQHFGGPTRLLDVSASPLVAMWFAVEKQFGETTGEQLPDLDGRIFAFDVSERRLDLADPYWGVSKVPWAEDYESDTNWGRGRPWHWVPPALNERIPAQLSGFLIDGVPRVSAGQNGRYRRQPGTGMGTWPIAEVRAATSIPTRLVQQGQAVQDRATPTFTIRVTSAAKPEIRERLQETMGYRASTIYPDLFGLAQYVATDLPRRQA